MKRPGWRRIIGILLRLTRATILDRSLFKDMMLAILFLTTAFSSYVAWQDRYPKPQLTYIPYAAIDHRGKQMTGFALVSVDLTEPVPLEKFYQAIVQIETTQKVRQARPLIKIVIKPPKKERDE